jgi:glycerol-1-phosphate dehydrogenase [NAD(P)+]
MSDFFFQTYLNRYSQDGTLHCECGREHHMGTRKIQLGAGVIQNLPEVLRDLYGADVKLWILSDENTEGAAARLCKQLLADFKISASVLPAEPRPRTTIQIIESLSKEAGAGNPDLILSVGGGTISDIAKMVSLNLDVANWCVMTAASVDAFTSGTSALKLKYRHKTEPARASEYVFADLEMLEKAPELMFLSGVGDLLAKYLSYLDWKISALISGEYICEQTARLCLDSARQAMSAVKTLADNRREAVQSLADAALVSGLAMQTLVSSRPASSAEHTIAHSWEIGGDVGNPELELHGLLVGLSCRCLLEGYKTLYDELGNLDIDPEARVQELCAEPHWEQTLSPAIQPFRQQMQEEMSDWVSDGEVYRHHLEKILMHREQIVDLAIGLLKELDQAVAVLSDLSYPFSLADYRLDPQQVLASARYARFLRNRYSTFNLIHEIGADDRIFSILRDDLKALR